MIPYGKQDIDENDIAAVVEVLKSDFLTQGPKIPAFEKSITDYTGALYATAANSATSALHIACLALDVGKGDIVWTSPVTFVASANCALYCGAEVDFVDIDEKTFNMSVLALEKKLIEAEKQNKLPKVVIPVHLCGQSCDMRAIKKLSDKYDFKVIEDASHAIGARYKNEPIGNCKYSNITVFSFHPVKIITTAEGGIATTNSTTLNERMSMFRSHGITRDEALMTEPSHGAWYYQQIDLGFNYRMTDIQAALGLNQMKRLDHFVEVRNQIADRYDDLLRNLPIDTPYQSTDCLSSRHLYVIKLKNGENRKQVFEQMRENGIGVNLHYIPVHLQPYYQNLGHKNGDYPAAEDYYSKAISIPLFSGLTRDNQLEIVKALKTSLY